MGVRLCIVEPNMRDALAAAGLCTYDDFVKSDRGDIAGRSGTTRTRRFEIGPVGRRDVVYLKVYRYDGGRWRHRFRRDKAWIEARNYRYLRERCGVRVPDVIAHGARRGGLRLKDAFLLTRGIPGSTPLDAFADARWPGGRTPNGDAARARLMAESADLVRRMHDGGFFHVDLQWRNLLVVDDERDGPALWVIDSPRGGPRRWSPRRMHGRLRDLSSLHKSARGRLSRGEQLRWLRRYAGPAATDADRRAIIRTLLRDRDVKDQPPP